MGQHVIVHRYEESSSGVLRVEESGSFDPDADDSPQWVSDALGQREDAPEEQPRITPWTADQVDQAQPAAVIAETPFLSDEDDEDDEDDEVPVPPKGGAGSGVQAWATYAQANDVELQDGMTRDEIVAACEDGGVPTD